MLSTRFTTLVGCSVPIQQAGMGGVAGPGLAAAVAAAGALGMIGGARIPAPVLTQVLDELREKAPGAVGVNILMPFLDRACVEVAASRVRVVEFFYDTPDPALIRMVHAGGALACWQIGSEDEARAAADAGADLIVAQGMEAGGPRARDHRPAAAPRSRARHGRRAGGCRGRHRHRAGHGRRARRGGRCRARGDAIRRRRGVRRASRLSGCADPGGGGRHGPHRGVLGDVAARAAPGPALGGGCGAGAPVRSGGRNRARWRAFFRCRASPCPRRLARPLERSRRWRSTPASPWARCRRGSRPRRSSASWRTEQPVCWCAGRTPPRAPRRRTPDRSARRCPPSHRRGADRRRARRRWSADRTARDRPGSGSGGTCGS